MPSLPLSLVAVIFCVHEGARSYGDPTVSIYDCVHQSQDVVIALVYRRLATFGFLSHPGFASGTLADYGIGFFDEVRALKWVKDYIYYPDKLLLQGMPESP